MDGISAVLAAAYGEINKKQIALDRGTLELEQSEMQFIMDDIFYQSNAREDFIHDEIEIDGEKYKLEIPPKYSSTISRQFLNRFIVIFALILMAATNIMGLYRYLVMRRKKELLIYKIYGIRNGRLFAIILLETIILVTLGFMAGIILFTAITRIAGHWFVVTASPALLREEYTLNRISNGCDFDNAVYFSRSHSVPHTGEETSYDNKVDDLLKEMAKNAFSIGKITYLYTYMEAVEENAFLLDYNETTIEHMKLPLSQGRWFQAGVCNEAILSYEYKKRYDIGDKVPLVIPDDSGRHELEVEVIGFLEKSDYMMNFTSSGYVDMSALIGQEKSAIITSGLEDVNGQACELGESSGVLIFGPISQNNGYYEKLIEFGAVTTMEEIAENYQENVKNRLYNLAGIDVVLFVLALSGLGSMNFISLYTKRREYGIYFICGLSRKMVVLMTAMIDLFIMAAAFIPATVFCFFNPDIIPNFDIVNVIVTIGIIGVILIVSFIPFYVITKKDSVVNLTRR